MPVANEIILLGTVKDSKLIQPAKEYSPIRSIPLGRVVNFRRLQFSNALFANSFNFISYNNRS